MKLERLHESIPSIIVLVAGLGLAIYAGLAISSGAIGRVGLIITGIIAVSLVLTVRERMWMLIPATWMLSGKMSFLPLPFSVAQLGVSFAFGTFLLLRAFKIIRLKPKFGLVETVMFVNIFYVLTVFIRNPAGVEALGSERVGGRPYVDAVVAIAGYMVLARATAGPKEAFIVPLMVGIGHGISVALNFFAILFPGLAAPLVKIYSGIAVNDEGDGVLLPDQGENRKAYLQGFGAYVVQAACALWRPLTLIIPLNFWRFLVFLIGMLMILVSGFRSAVVTAFVMFMLGTYFRRGIADVIRIGVISVLGLGLLLLLQGNVLDLPRPIQRSLSFLPGKWDYSAKSEAEASTDWRMEMWKTILSSDKYIENKWLGDGFGFTRRQLQIMAANAQSASTADQQENLMISGGVHSGPISAIRFVGYVGLGLFLILLIVIAFRGAHLIRRAEGTPYFFLALFLGMPAIWYPFYFVLVFGGYEGDLPTVIIAVGMQKLLENSLDQYSATQSKAQEPASAPRFVVPPRRVPAIRPA